MGVSTALAVIDASKKALDIANELKNVELKSAILELKEEILALKGENLALKELLQKQADLEMVFEKNSYWNIKSDGTKEGPYCSVCWDKNKSVIRLTTNPVNTDFYKCGNCNNEYCVHNIEQY